MDVKTIYGNIIKILKVYEDELSGFSDVQFKQRAGEDVWSASEVYHHIFDSSLLSLDQIKSIMDGNGIEGKATLVGKAILFSGMFPPGIKFKAPERLVRRLRKIDISEAHGLIVNFETELEQVYHQLINIPLKLTAKHPRLGFFNTAQWFRFIEIHLNHHLKQLERIKKLEDKSQ